ncbi:22487_t:CDS:2 [Cetraspora pellucida]|uniref:22487_t:CDS:1 n=1 Tax=Cetraspora pellucida TaxID=1433469 RepID=A0A9N9DXE3_9GLOM|nr:22487_t:CDS:2 [Cetraspora pellucida]
MTIKQNLNTNIIKDEVIDYVYLFNTFDNDLDLQDNDEDYNQVIAEEETNKKNLKINNPQKLSMNEALLATILNSCNKKINKATAIDQLKAKSLLNTKYKLLKSNEFEANIQNNLKKNKKNKLLYVIYGSNL